MMLSCLSLYKGAKYSRITGEDYREQQGRSKLHPWRIPIVMLFFSIMFSGLTGGLGYWAGTRSIPPDLPDWLGK